MKKYVFAFSFLFLSGTSFAANCVKSDPWDPVTQMKAGAFQGECIDTSIQRPLKILARGPSKNLNLQEGDTLVANFRHDQKFWIVIVRKDAIQSVAVEKQVITDSDFHHVRARLKLTKPFELIWEQSKGVISLNQYPKISTNPDAPKVDDVVLSVEAARSESNKGKAWDPTLSPGSYALVARMASEASLEADASAQAIDKVIPIDYSGLTGVSELSNAELNQKLLTAYIIHSDKEGLEGSYNLATRNCSKELLKVFDSAYSLFYSNQVEVNNIWQRIYDMNPENVDRQLVYRGLSKSGS